MADRLNPPLWKMIVQAALSGHIIHPYAIKIAAREVREDDRIPCDICGRRWPTSLIDTKDSGNGNYERMECPTCYGPGWSTI